MSRSSTRRAACLGAALFAALTAGALPAFAQTDDADDNTDSELIVLSGDLVVPAGTTVSTAVAFNGDATIDGTVTETLVVFNGGATITGTVREDVVVFNGPVTVVSGATVGGDVASQETPQIADDAEVGGERTGLATRFEWAEIGFAGRFAWWLGYSISTLILGLVLLLVAPAVDGAIQRTASRRMGASIGVGAALFFLTPVVAVLLLVTIVGFPLGFFLLLALAFLYSVGYVAGAHAIGRFVVKPPSSRFVAFLAGWGIVRVLALIPFLGGLVWALAAIFGLGVLFVASRRAPRQDQVFAPETPPPPPMAARA